MVGNPCADFTKANFQSVSCILVGGLEPVSCIAVHLMQSLRYAIARSHLSDAVFVA